MPVAQPPERPLLSFALVGFNQEAFIREAVEAALAQTYSPLEVVLSDDCSQDRTFEIMQEIAATYRGPHRIVLNRNPVRRSLGGHINRVMEISQGELVIVAAGDDVSLPQRSQVMYEAWEWSGRRATSIHADIIQIDGSGREIPKIYAPGGGVGEGGFVTQRTSPLEYVRTLSPLVIGAAHAWSRKLFSIFGDLPEDLVHEDNVLPLRTVLAGEMVYVPQVLAKYRLHSNNVFLQGRGVVTDARTFAAERDRVRRGLGNRQRMYEAFLLDLATATRQGLIGPEEADLVAAEAGRRRDHLCLLCDFLERGLVAKLGAFLRLHRDGLQKGEGRLLLRNLAPAWVVLPMRRVRASLGRA
jgi:glycosyltransferase involved in cell wall biosynthesis